MPAGRPTKYKPEYCESIIEYFDVEHTRIVEERFYYKNGDEKVKEIEVANELPTVEGYAHSIGVNKTTLHEWNKKHTEFSNAFKKARELQEKMWLTNSLKGLYPGAFTIFAGKNMFGWRDKQDIEHTTPINLTLNGKLADV